MPCDYVDMVRPDATLIAFDEKGIPRRNVVTKRRSPEIIVATLLKHRRNFISRDAKGAYFQKDVDDWLGRETGDRRTSKMLDATNHSSWQVTPETSSFPFK